MEECKRCYYDSGEIFLEEYFKDGELHRDNLPAYISYFPCGRVKLEGYYKNGYCTREDGPAFICYNINGKISWKTYWLDSVYYIDEHITDNWEAFCKMQIFR